MFCFRVVQWIGEDHQPDVCPAACTTQHCFFYVRACPSHCKTTRPGSKRKRRLDFKMDLSAANNVGCFQDLMGLGKAQLEVLSENLFVCVC